ncbi:alkylated DNA repair protein AlkB [Dendryphion nanum]|uniref:mRNA N(6)-methyladenine demethylase n=1 Tax=Dendryphion nanum TaxID=256645 RepID=A0A9P9DIB4_9PLEO|nr:alkylated DNA repair protein AlkB [Dendryphion nanum]
MGLLDPHQRPPDSMRAIYKKYQKMQPGDLLNDIDIVDLGNHLSDIQKNKISPVRNLAPEELNRVFGSFTADNSGHDYYTQPVPVYEHEDMPGLHIIPSLLPPNIQQSLLSRLLHHNLASPNHLTNIHTHYNLAYPPGEASFFSIDPRVQTPVATPLDPTIHRPLSISQLLNRKLRWTTLGGQYDWTAKRYPDIPPPAFPKDIKTLLEGIWHETKAEAAIVNLYSPGDTLSLHRDVAEFCDTGLISISLGCDAIFIIGTQSSTSDEEKVLALRLRSGSAVYMSLQSRFAWHGVPQIVANTCPDYLKDWPFNDTSNAHPEWKGWMNSKRINLNVRQMWAN